MCSEQEEVRLSNCPRRV